MSESEETRKFILLNTRLTSWIYLISSKSGGLSEDFSDKLLWVLEILVINHELQSGDLPKIKPLLDSQLHSLNYENKVLATEIFSKLIEEFGNEEHQCLLLGHENLHMLLT